MAHFSKQLTSILIPILFASLSSCALEIEATEGESDGLSDELADNADDVEEDTVDFIAACPQNIEYGLKIELGLDNDQERCFVFFEEEKSWEDAREHCEQFNMGDLLVYPYDEVNLAETVNSWAAARIGTQDVVKGAWYGAKADDSDQWLWVDGKSELYGDAVYMTPEENPHGSTVFWEGGQPSDVDSKRCLQIKDSTGAWVSGDCETELSFFCSFTPENEEESDDEES